MTPSQSTRGAVRASCAWIQLFGVILLSATGSAASAVEPPRWIWARGPANGAAGDEPWRFVRRFPLEQGFQEARLQFAADYCGAAVRVNGQDVLTVEPYCPTQQFDVTGWLKRGANEIEVVARSVPGPASFALSLQVKPTTGAARWLVSDGAWSVTRSGANEDAVPVVDRGPVAPELWGLDRRDIHLSPGDNYEQWQQSLAADTATRTPKFWAAPGFEITVVRVATREEGSWISMAFDAAGRLTIAREDRGLLRLTLSADRAAVDRVEPIDVELLECRGLAYRDGRLYANANNSKGLFRLTIDDAGQARDLTRLREFPGGVGHGRNDLALQGDSLLSIHGDSVDAPGDSATDRTSPLRESRRAEPGREGHLVRTNLDGSRWETLCAGLRNPYGVAVHPGGSPFTFDADNEYDMGAPWYRPTRILHLATGADFGYREATGRWPPRFHDQPDNMPPVLDIGRSSPTAVLFGNALAFPETYRQALFALDWTYGRVLAVHLSPRGAGWRAAVELFLQGRPLNVTDVAAGPDGAMYLITGGRKTQSALYRVACAKPRDPPPLESARDDEHVRFARLQWERVRALNAENGTSLDLNAVLDALGDADPVVRHTARVALERQPIPAWRPAALAPRAGTIGLQALMSLARAREADDVPAILDRLTSYEPRALGIGARLVWLRTVSLCAATAPDALRKRRDEFVPRIVEIWTTSRSTRRGVAPEGTADDVRRQAALLLGELQASELPALAAAELLASPAQEDRLAGLLALRHQRQGWTIDLRRRQFEAINGMSQMVAGQGMPIFEQKLRSESAATLTNEERQSVARLLEPAAPIDEPLPPARPFVRKWTVDDLTSLLDAEAAKGDAARGRTLYRDALCARCHQMGTRGPAIGPDLTFVAGRFSRRNMLESILAPSLSVAENYRQVVVVTERGQVHTGQVVAEGDYRSQKLKLNTEPLHPSRTTEIDKREIAEYRSTGVSPMPEGLLDTFPLEAIRDLLAYLESGGAP